MTLMCLVTPQHCPMQQSPGNTDQSVSAAEETTRGLCDMIKKILTWLNPAEVCSVSFRHLRLCEKVLVRVHSSSFSPQAEGAVVPLHRTRVTADEFTFTQRHGQQRRSWYVLYFVCIIWKTGFSWSTLVFKPGRWDNSVSFQVWGTFTLQTFKWNQIEVVFVVSILLHRSCKLKGRFSLCWN